MVDFDSSSQANLASLVDQVSKNGLFELAKLGIDPNPMFDVSLRRIHHRRGLAGEQNVIFVGGRIGVHRLETLYVPSLATFIRRRDYDPADARTHRNRTRA